MILQVDGGGFGAMKPAELPDGRVVYDMDGSCGYLNSDGLCSVYKDPRRPQTCGDTEPGCYGCTTVRVERGLMPIQTDEGFGWQ